MKMSSVFNKLIFENYSRKSRQLGNRMVVTHLLVSDKIGSFYLCLVFFFQNQEITQNTGQDKTGVFPCCMDMEKLNQSNGKVKLK